MRFTEYTLEHFEPGGNGYNKIHYWIDGPSIDFLDYTVNKNKEYKLSPYDIKTLVFNFLTDKNQDRVIDIIANTHEIDQKSMWEAILSYSFNSNMRPHLIRLGKYVLQKKCYPTLTHAIKIIASKDEELINMLTDCKTDFNFSELKFSTYVDIVSNVKSKDLEILERLGFKRVEDWDTTIKTLRENNVNLKHCSHCTFSIIPNIDNYLSNSPSFFKFF